MYLISLRKKGFSLIELLVVIAVIGILASIIMASVNSARDKGLNARRVTDIAQYQLALELYRDANGEYPDTASWACLGDYSGDSCWIGGSVSEQSVLSTALEPYIPGLPAVEVPVEGATESRVGYIYIDRPPQGYRIRYHLEGTAQDCGPGILYDSGDDTDCRLCGGTEAGDSFCESIYGE